MWKSVAVCLLMYSATLAAEVKIVAFSGSTRADSANKKLIEAAAKLARDNGAQVTVVDLKEFPMPLYDGDLEEKDGLPKHAKRLQELMVQSDAIIIASPEYNGSMSGVLKNSLDWVTRTEDCNYTNAAIKGKKFAIMSASPGPSGGVNGLKDLQKTIQILSGTVVDTQVAVKDSYNAFDENGALKDSKTQELLEKEVKELF